MLMHIYIKKFRLSDLILKIGKNKKLKRIRYTTSHPKDMTDDLVNCYKQEKINAIPSFACTKWFR